jgi:hypothetical protein
MNAPRSRRAEVTIVPRSAKSEPPALPLPEPARVYFTSPGCVMATWNNISFAIWGTQATLPLVERFTMLSNELVRQHPRLSSVHVILDEAPLPAGEARTKLTKLSERFEPNLACVLTVISGSGFWNSAMRGFITSLHWIVSPRYKVLTCGTVKEGAAWFAPLHSEHTGVAIDGAGLEHLVVQLLTRLERVALRS